MRTAVAAVLVLLAVPGTAAAAPTLVPVGTFAEPVHAAGPPGDAARLFVVEKAGRVQLVVGGQRVATPFLDIAGSVEDTGERGLLSIAFPYDYGATGVFYVFYTDNGGDLVVQEGRRTAADPNRGALGRTLFTVEHSSATNHNGGQLAFGPDGALYVSIGDGATDPDSAQDPVSLLGKIVRIDPRTPAGPRVWALGLRNPWRFSFDRITGDMLIGDVGAGLHEEIDFAPAGSGAGRNYGWPACEGAEPTPCPIPGAVPPALSLPRSGYRTVIGGFVVRDPGLPSLVARYLFADPGQTHVQSALVGSSGGTGLRPEPDLPVSSPSSFGEDGCGHVHVVSLGGQVSRIQDGALGACVVPPPPPTPPGPPIPTVPPSADTTPCTIRVVSRGPQRILRRGRRLRLALRANEACTATLRAQRFRTRRVSLPANVKRVVRLVPTRKGLRRMRRAVARSERGRLRIVVRIRARDAAGNPSILRVRRTVR